MKSQPLGSTQRDQKQENDGDCTSRTHVPTTAGATAVSEGAESSTKGSGHPIEDSLSSFTCPEPHTGLQDIAACSSHNDTGASEKPQADSAGKTLMPNTSCASFSTEVGLPSSSFKRTGATVHDNNGMLYMVLKTRQKLIDEMKKLHALKADKAAVCDARQALAQMLGTFSKDVVLRASEHMSMYGETTATPPAALSHSNLVSDSRMNSKNMDLQTFETQNQRGGSVQEVSNTAKTQGPLCGGVSQVGQHYAMAWYMVGYPQYNFESMPFLVTLLACPDQFTARHFVF